MDKINVPNKIQIKKYSEMGDKWSIEPDQSGITGVTQIDIDFGEKILDFLKSKGLHLEIMDGNWMEKQRIRLGSENTKKEYRCEVKMSASLEDHEYDFRLENDIDEDQELTPGQEEMMMIEYEKLPLVEFDDDASFSIFLGKNFPQDRLPVAAAYIGFIYTKMLSDAFNTKQCNMVSGGINDDVLDDDIEGVKKYLKVMGVNITNKNLELVSRVKYRLYKDSKFYAALKNDLKDFKYLMDEFLKL